MHYEGRGNIGRWMADAHFRAIQKRERGKQMIIKLDSEVIAEIRNALTIISLSAETMEFEYPFKAMVFLNSQLEKRDVIKEQVKRISKLLPQVEFEEGKDETQNSSTV